MTDLGKTQLNAILSALDGQPRNPNTKDAALRRIGAHAERFGVGLDELLAAAAGFLDGRMSAESFRTSLQDDAAEAAGQIEPLRRRRRRHRAARAAPVPAGEPASAENATATAADEGAPVATGAAPAGAPDATAEQPAAKVRKHRDGTKEAMLIDMLRRPEGATIAQIMVATGWQAHTVRGAFAGALKKKRGLDRHLGEAGRRRAGVPTRRLIRTRIWQDTAGLAARRCCSCRWRSRSVASSSNVRPSSASTAGLPVAVCQRLTATST